MTKLNLDTVVVANMVPTAEFQRQIEDSIRNHEDYITHDRALAKPYRANFYWPMLKRVGPARFAAHIVVQNSKDSYRKDWDLHLRTVDVAMATERLTRSTEMAVLRNPQFFSAELVNLAHANLQKFTAISKADPAFDLAAHKAAQAEQAAAEQAVAEQAVAEQAVAEQAVAEQAAPARRRGGRKAA